MYVFKEHLKIIERKRKNHWKKYLLKNDKFGIAAYKQKEVDMYVFFICEVADSCTNRECFVLG